MVKGMHGGRGHLQVVCRQQYGWENEGRGREGSSALAAVIQHPTDQPLSHDPAQKWGDLSAGQVHAKPAAGSTLGKPLPGINSPPFSLPGENADFNLTHGQPHMLMSLSQHKLMARMLGEEGVQRFGL